MRIYVHGNCQASAIGWTLQESQPHWDIQSREVHTFDVASSEVYEAYREQVRRADLILAQPISDGYRDVEFLSLSWLRANKSSDATIAVFPSIYFRGYNPFSFDLHMDGHIMGYHDVHVADMFLAGVSSEECHHRIASPSFFTRDFAQSEFFRNLRTLARREQAAAVDAFASPFILNHYDQELLFHTFNHPGRSVMCSVINQLMRVAGLDVTIAASGPSYLNNIRIMPYRSLATHLDMQEAALHEMGLMIRLDVVESLRNYVEAAYDCYRAAGPEAVRKRICAYPEAEAYLQRFNQSGKVPRFEGSPLALSLFRILLGREPSDWEVQYWVKVLDEVGPGEAMRCFVESTEYQDRLGRGAKAPGV